MIIHLLDGTYRTLPSLVPVGQTTTALLTAQTNPASRPLALMHVTVIDDRRAAEASCLGVAFQSGVFQRCLAALRSEQTKAKREYLLTGCAFVVYRTEINRRKETEHFDPWLQKEVAKIVHCHFPVSHKIHTSEIKMEHDVSEYA
jgi:hypothetical protein